MHATADFWGDLFAQIRDRLSLSTINTKIVSALILIHILGEKESNHRYEEFWYSELVLHRVTGATLFYMTKVVTVRYDALGTFLVVERDV